MAKVDITPEEAMHFLEFASQGECSICDELVPKLLAAATTDKDILQDRGVVK